MDDLFLQLCIGVAAALEILKPAIKSALNITDTSKPVYQAGIWLVAALVGIAGAFALQVNVAPSWMGVPPVVGVVFTGILSAFGSEVAHRVLEIIEAVSKVAQNKAATSGALPEIIDFGSKG
jgi:hypothetical protein